MIIRPVITEKTIAMVNLENKYTFMVDTNANKIEIAKAVAKKYNVTVLDVNMIMTIGKIKNFGKKRISGRRKSNKKAIVTLKAKETIADFNVG
jgi:large subunit ribosomal protein L23